MWIGGKRLSQDADFSWTDGSLWSFTNWKTGEPSDTGNCVATELNSWKIYNCSSIHSFVCQQPQEIQG